MARYHGVDRSVHPRLILPVMMPALIAPAGAILGDAGRVGNRSHTGQEGGCDHRASRSAAETDSPDSPITLRLRGASPRADWTGKALACTPRRGVAFTPEWDRSAGSRWSGFSWGR